MTLWFLAFLAVAWIVVYIPAAWRARQTSPFPAVQRFKRRMRLISPKTSAGRWIVVPGARQRSARQAFHRAQQRRKAILLGLVCIAVATGVWAIFAGGEGLEINLVADAAATFYAALLLDAKRRRTERGVKVRPLQRPAPVESDYLEVIEAGGGQNR